MEHSPWDLKEAMEYFKGQGAPQNQSALVELLREVQQENSGILPAAVLADRNMESNRACCPH